MPLSEGDGGVFLRNCRQCGLLARVARPRCAPRSGVPMAVRRVGLCPSVGSCFNGAAIEGS